MPWKTASFYPLGEFFGLGMAIGVLLGTIGYRSRIANSILTPIYDVMQTTPIFAYLVPVLVFFGFGPVAALLATIVFAMPPMARVTTLAPAKSARQHRGLRRHGRLHPTAEAVAGDAAIGPTKPPHRSEPGNHVVAGGGHRGFHHRGGRARSQRVSRADCAADWRRGGSGSRHHLDGDRARPDFPGCGLAPAPPSDIGPCQYPQTPPLCKCVGSTGSCLLRAESPRQLQKIFIGESVQPNIHAVSWPMWHVVQVHHL